MNKNMMRRMSQRTGFGLATLLFAIVFGGTADAVQVRFQIQRQQLGAVQLDMGVGFAMPHNLALDEDEEIDVESGAVLKTDPDLEGILEQAERFRKDGDYRVACQLWQAVLQRSGDALYSSDSTSYFSLVEQVERILASLPPEGLEAYRVLADAQAKEIIAEAGSKSDEIALNKVVRQYFLSSLGDEAAFDLGCIYLDRFDFIGARRMFEKIVKQYPDPTVSLDEVHARIALCQSYLGDMKAAKASLEQADAINENTESVSLVRRSLGELSSFVAGESVDSNWLMPMGNSHRTGLTSGVPDRMMERDLVAVWQFYFDPRDKYTRSADILGKMLSGKKAHGADVVKTMLSMETRLVDAWKEKSWRPAGQLLIDNKHVYFKTGADLSVWDREKIDKLSKEDVSTPELNEAIGWRSVWQHAFDVDEATKMMKMIRQSYGAFNRRGGATGLSLPDPTSDAEIFLFGDRIFNQMSICDGILYNIEGHQFNYEGANRAPSKQVTAQWNATFRRSRVNHLTAYDADTGEVKWTLPRKTEAQAEAAINQEEEESPWLDNGGFMAAPIQFADLILVPVNMGGSISIYALDPQQEGKTVWKSFLCDEPETGAVPWSAIDLSIDGSDLFVNCGMGVVFVLDPATGLVRFAKRYRRVGKPDDFQRRNNWTVNRLNFNGWSSDVVVPYGRQMICFSSDTNTIEAFDRNTGKTIWRSDMSPIGHKVDYLLGVHEDVLFAAGKETIVAYDLKGEGRMLWGCDQEFDDKISMGQGLLTPKGIYMPVADSIYHFSLKGKNGEAEILNKVGVDLGTGAPVGNLFSDGERFWVHGANRLYALGMKP